VETEAAMGAHNNQPTDGSDSDRNSIRGGDSINTISMLHTEKLSRNRQLQENMESCQKPFLVRPQYAPPFFSQSSVFQIFIHCGIHNSSLWETTLLLHLPSLITINSSLE
jgi:hypothetical protein